MKAEWQKHALIHLQVESESWVDKSSQQPRQLRPLWEMNHELIISVKQQSYALPVSPICERIIIDSENRSVCGSESQVDNISWTTMMICSSHGLISQVNNLEAAAPSLGIESWVDNISQTTIYSLPVSPCPRDSKKGHKDLTFNKWKRSGKTCTHPITSWEWITGW